MLMVAGAVFIYLIYVVIHPEKF
ncbi:potassium-transporting ATPase subunit F [Kroppenstedtia sanguinis]|uniref:Potassium-transporting ATPase subunit F n=1 Tax=Kroppenstedtia sanguinis TaxID=1380684 RepID=A0ABW4CEV9_9BACL